MVVGSIEVTEKSIKTEGQGDSSPSEIVSVDAAEQETLPSEIKVLYGTYWYSYMENPQWKHEGDVIPTAEVALRVAKNVFYAMSEEKPHINNYQPIGIMYDEPHGYWMVLFQEPPSKPGMIVLGDAYTVVLQKSDGRVVQISWSE